jgi:hypothetical protein
MEASLRSVPPESLPLAFALQNSQNHGCNYFAPLRPQFPPLLQKLAMPFPSLRATIVLPVFTRSLPADGKCFRFQNIMGIKLALYPCAGLRFAAGVLISFFSGEGAGTAGWWGLCP